MLKFFKKRDVLKDVTVGQKIVSIVGLCIALLIVVAITGIVQMQKVGNEITEIAEQDLPLIEAVSAITVHQLEQAVNFERILRYGEEMANGDGASAIEEQGADTSGNTAMLGANLLYEMLCVLPGVTYRN